MKRGLFTLTCFVLLAARVGAQDLKLPAEVKAERGRLAQVVIESKGAETAWTILPPRLDAFREYHPDPAVIKLRILAYTDGEFFIVASTSVKDKVTQAVCRVVVGNPAPPPGPNPPPDPEPQPPGPPTDPFKRLVYDAWQKEAAQDKALAPKLAAVYQAIGDGAADTPSKTCLEYAHACARMRAVQLGDAMKAVRTAVAVEADRVLPTATDAPMDAATRKAWGDFYRRAAQAVGEVCR